MKKEQLYFLLFLVGTWPLRYLPYKTLHLLGRGLGLCVYYILPKFRKRTLSNLSLASSLSLSPAALRSLAKASLQNLLITCLEYPKLATSQGARRAATCVNPEVAAQLMKEGTPVIFFCGHQANWEVLFLEGTQRMPGVAIGRPIKNTALYQWILSIREQFGGKIITPQNAIREGLRALKRGCFLGIVGDQGMPDSGYSSPFLGRKAWTSPIAAILSHRTGAPLIVATTKRKAGHYFIHYSDPLWPNKEAPMEEEVDRLMRAALHHLEETIKAEPSQWLWSHNRWKQQTPDKLKKRYRHESLLIILSEESPLSLPEDLRTFRHLYPHEFITIYTPLSLLEKTQLEGAEILPYAHPEELLKEDFRFKLVFNFTSLRALESHFKKQAAFTVVPLKTFNQQTPFSEQLTHLVLKS